MVVSPEFSFKNAFRSNTLHATKLLFEGKGALIRTGLYKQFENAYKGCTFIVGSNYLPASEAINQEESFKQDIWGPICTRTTFVCFTT